MVNFHCSIFNLDHFRIVHLSSVYTENSHYIFWYFLSADYDGFFKLRIYACIFQYNQEHLTLIDSLNQRYFPVEALLISYHS